jgi:hypothetical protein
MVKPSASRGWPLAAQPGRVTISTRSNAFSERCATEHGVRESPEQLENLLVTQPRRLMKSGGAADLTADQRCIQPVESGSKNQRFCWSMGIWWAWEDLNLRPHPFSNHALTAVQPCVFAGRG